MNNIKPVDFVFDKINYEYIDNFIKTKYENTMINIETSIIKIPFGVKKSLYNDQYYIQVSTNNTQNKELMNFIHLLEKDLKDKLKNDFKDKKFTSRIYVKENHTPLILLDLKKDTITLDNKNNKINIDQYIDQPFLAVLDFNYSGIWYNDSKYGMSLKINNIFIKQNYESYDSTKIIF